MIKFNINDVDYFWNDYILKEWFYSREKNEKVGNVKFIGNKLFYISKIGKPDLCNLRVEYRPIEKDYTVKEGVVKDYFASDIEINMDIRNEWFKENFLK